MNSLQNFDALNIRRFGNPPEPPMATGEAKLAYVEAFPPKLENFRNENFVQNF